jgi:ribonuclease BN (tRNA processing enzyme)
MRVTFLGTADGHTSAFREHSGIIVQAAESSLLLDCGANVSGYLQQKKYSPDFPESIWISHMHSDHIGQLSMLIQSLWLRARRAPLHLYAPQTIVATLQDWFEKCLLFPELLGFPIYWHAVKSGRQYAQGAFVFHAFGTNHLKNLAGYFQNHYPLTCFECYGVTITYKKKRYVYSADLALPRELRPALKPSAQALFCELTHFSEQLLFEELARHKLDQVFITHYPDHLWKKEAELKRIARSAKFHGKVSLMRDRQSVVI